MTMQKSKLKISDLKPAKYNPRVISTRQLQSLHKSVHKFGDLSGVVFNIKTKRLISGHQRMKTLKTEKHEIFLEDVTDDHGTVKAGYILAHAASGDIRVPLRLVNWNEKAEKAANISANAQGGDFDTRKLAMLVEELEKDKKFDIELLGLDPDGLKTLRLVGNQFKINDQKEFDKIDEEKLGSDLTCVCPRCKFKFKP